MDDNSTQRNIVLVIQMIINEIPESEFRLKKKLNDYIHSLWNLAPEVLNSGSVWIPVQDILNSYIKTDRLNEPWVQKTIRIFNNDNE